MPKIHYTRFPITSSRRGSCQLVTDLLRENWCNGFWPSCDAVLRPASWRPPPGHSFSHYGKSCISSKCRHRETAT